MFSFEKTKFQIAECCITDLPEGLRYSDSLKCAFSQNNLISAGKVIVTRF